MRLINLFLKKAFGFQSIILPFDRISYFLTKVAKSHSYVETLGDHADSLHDWIKKSYEQDLKRAFEITVIKTLRRLGISRAELSLDITHEPFYGKTRSIYVFDVPKKDNKKYKGEYRFMNVCLINRGKQIPLMSLPVHLGSGMANLTIDLLKYCRTLFKNIKFALFDRGFYVAELIDFLEAKKINYLMLVPEKKGKIKEYIKKTDELGKFVHQMVYSKQKSKWKPKTRIVVCKKIDEFVWLFATNINFTCEIDYVLLYKRRWQIETNFRVEDEARIKSKSIFYMIRYFYHLIGLLFHISWILFKNQSYYVPFKKYLDEIEHKWLFDFLGICRL